MTPYERDKTGPFCRRPDELHAELDPWGRGVDDELVRRLRSLQWPEVSDDVRQRCWAELTKRVSATDGGAAEPARPQGDRNPYWRNEFTPRRLPIHGEGALRERVAASRGLSRPVAGYARARTAALALR